MDVKSWKEFNHCYAIMIVPPKAQFHSFNVRFIPKMPMPHALRYSTVELSLDKALAAIFTRYFGILKTARQL